MASFSTSKWRLNWLVSDPRPIIGLVTLPQLCTLLFRTASRVEVVAYIDLLLRFVYPTTLIEAFLSNCYKCVEGGHQGIVKEFHRVNSDKNWTRLYADVTRHIHACEDCSSSNSTPYLRGLSLSSLYFSKKNGIHGLWHFPLPVTRLGSTSLLMFQDYFTGRDITGN